MTITTKTFQNLQPGVSAADDLRVRRPVNEALNWLGEGLIDELNTHFSSISTSFSQISQSVSVQIAAALSGTAGEQTYVEGTFTPVLAFGGASTGITYSVQTGAYTRIGRVVHFDLQITLTSKGSATGAATISGLPLMIGGTGPATIQVSGVTAGVGDTVVIASLGATGTTISLQDIASGSVASLTDVDFGNGSLVRVQGVYRTSA